MLRKAWLDAIGRQDWHPSPHTYVCGDHFPPECYVDQAPPPAGAKVTKRKHLRLRGGAVPSRFARVSTLLKLNYSTTEVK